MSRGWESKSVEEQQAQAAAANSTEKPPNPAGERAAEADHKRKVQALELQRERILSERTSSPHRRSALELALADSEEKLSELGWTIHLG
jgi:hypothetical protein